MTNNYYDKYVKYKTKYNELKKIKGGDIKQISVQEPWFSYIRDGIKKIEGRLNKGLFASFKVGDVVIWFTFDKNTRQRKEFKTKIIKINKYKTFEEMISTEGLQNILPGIKTIQDGIEIYRQWYNEQVERQFGVVGIVVEVFK
ncbi:ASCh domain-containing protein [Fadolivirus algeromassiliense]|jgi:ASC-1-like (ASCH) protein|uniref:ASCh domain-containing protein n=1 Tax=Fadolivirus FV1/VV64 TaxID=3070911 RepID=A0A7D3QVC8_9VIRU|nr:ASCh domain-containing protein [Fadolivirus algeromassiliense]QKF93479.1 ASCh domain-containing protein [Fadolivirus FV1/VV64]